MWIFRRINTLWQNVLNICHYDTCASESRPERVRLCVHTTEPTGPVPEPFHCDHIARWSARSGTTGRSGTGVNTGARLRSGTAPVPKLWCEHGLTQPVTHMEMETRLTAYSARHPHSNGNQTHRLLCPSPTCQCRPDLQLTPPVTHMAMETWLTAYSASHPHSNGDKTHRLLCLSPTRQYRPDSLIAYYRCVPDSTLLPRSRREVLLYCYDRQSFLYCVTMYTVTVSYVGLYNTKTT